MSGKRGRGAGRGGTRGRMRRRLPCEDEDDEMSEGGEGSDLIASDELTRTIDDGGDLQVLASVGMLG
jgi:hypothetical protein